MSKKKRKKDEMSDVAGMFLVTVCFMMYVAPCIFIYLILRMM